MPDTTKYDILKTGLHLQSGAAICLVSNVNNGGTIAISGTWTGLPAENEEVKFGRIRMENNWTDRAGVEHPDDLYKGFVYKSMFQQRDADTFDFDLTYVGKECVLFTPMHYFQKLASPKKQYLAIFGTVRLNGSESAGKDGTVPFEFWGQTNNQAIVMKVTGSTGELSYPSITGLQIPTGTITIPVYTGRAGIYKIIDE